jgi:hypothetical protein
MGVSGGFVLVLPFVRGSCDIYKALALGTSIVWLKSCWIGSS